MNFANAMQMARFIGGMVLIGLYAVTELDGMVLGTALVLLGVPFELAKTTKKED